MEHISNLNAFHVGQKVQIVSDTRGIHCAIVPSVGQIVHVYGDSYDVMCRTRISDNRIVIQAIYACDLRPIDDEII